MTALPVYDDRSNDLVKIAMNSAMTRAMTFLITFLMPALTLSLLLLLNQIQGSLSHTYKSLKTSQPSYLRSLPSSASHSYTWSSSLITLSRSSLTSHLKIANRSYYHSASVYGTISHLIYVRLFITSLLLLF